MSTPKDPPIPIRLPKDLLAEVDRVAEQTGLSKQDVMRLCMRIGLVDIAAAEHDIPGIVQSIASDKGVSFQEFAKLQNRPFQIKEIIGPDAVDRNSLIEKQVIDLAKSSECAAPATSSSTSPTSKHPPSKTAQIVPLPKQHMRSTAAPLSKVAEETGKYGDKNGTED